MPISNAVREALVQASWIRKMFEEGLRLKRLYGADRVADLSLGNPVVEPPPEVLARLREVAADETPGLHRYMPNAGLLPTREAVARHLAARTGVPYGPEHVVMTVGAGGGLNVVLRSILDPGDEVLLLAPYFVEYLHYVASHGGRAVVVPTDERFRPDPDALRRAITERTRALLLNSPNNPTGVVYGDADLARVAEVLARASAGRERPILLLSDEPYRAIVYDGVDVPWPVNHYPATVHVTSFSKDLALPGERIGYVAIPPRLEGAETLVRAVVFSMRALGFVNAPALQQRLVETLLEVTVDVTRYDRTRRRILAALDASGIEVVRPEGAFYVFPRTPGGMDDVAFAEAALEERLLVVPGTGFGRPGYFRISYAVDERTVDLALALLPEVLRRVTSRA